MTWRLGTGGSVKNAFVVDSKSCTSEPLRNRTEVQHARAVSQHMLLLIILRPMAWIVFRLPLGISALLLPYKCKNIYRGTFPEAYAQKTCKALGDGTYSFGLVACSDIPPFTEILVNYGASYLYPTHYED